jgi:phage gpG-like protein
MTLGFTADGSRFARFARSASHALDAPMREEVLRDATGESAERYMAAMRSRFSQAAGGDGTWKDLEPSTKLARLRKAGVRSNRDKRLSHAEQLAAASARRLPILMDTGTLFASLNRGAPGSLDEATMRQLVRGTNVRYAHWHQTGGTIPRRPPQREIFVNPTGYLLERMATPIQAAVATLSKTLVQQAIAA